MQLFIDPPTPFIDGALDQAKAAAWVAGHEEPIRGCAKTFINNIQYIPHEQFVAGLQTALTKFQHYLENKINKKYIFVFPEEFCANENFTSKSNPWVAAIAMHFLTIYSVELVKSVPYQYHSYQEYSHLTNSIPILKY